MDIAGTTKSTKIITFKPFLLVNAILRILLSLCDSESDIKRGM